MLNWIVLRKCKNTLVIVPWYGKRFTHYSSFVQGIHSSLLDFSGNFPSQKASDVELWLFISYQPDYAVSQTVEMLVTWDGVTSSKGINSHGKMTLTCAVIFSTVYSEVDQRKHQGSASLAFVWGIHRGLVNSPHKWPVTRIMLPFDNVIMQCKSLCNPLLAAMLSSLQLIFSNHILL